MELTNFRILLASFAQRPVPPLTGRHIYLWHAELASLRAIAPPGLIIDLDLGELARSAPRTPTASDEARRVVQAALQAWLVDNAPPAGAQQVVLITGAALLARYHVPLSPLFQWAGESQLFVFVLPSPETAFRPAAPLPPYVEFNPRATLEYLVALLGPQATIGVQAP